MSRADFGKEQPGSDFLRAIASGWVFDRRFHTRIESCGRNLSLRGFDGLEDILKLGL